MTKTVLLWLLGAVSLAFAIYWFSRILRLAEVGRVLIGFVTNFFDTLGIGNFAPTAASYRFTGLVRDEEIPATMNVGHTLPVVLMGFLFIRSVDVEATTLYTMIGAAVVGAWLGAGVVSRLPRRVIQVSMGIALLVAAGFLVQGQFASGVSDEGALELAPGPLVVGAVVIALLGALMTIGVGLYAPCMVLVAMLGMNPKASFPIMMGACAFLMPVASARFVRAEKYDWRAALGLTVGGLPAVLVAHYIVQSLPLYKLKWLVVVVVFVTGVMMLTSRDRSSNGA